MAEYYEMYDLDSEGEFAEARRSRGVKKPSSQPSFKPRPQPGTQQNAVTQAQLEAALTRVDGKIKTVADGVSTINSRLGGLAAASKKEAEDRKKGIEGQGRDLNQKLQLLALLPLLTQPGSVTITNPGADGLQDSSGTAITGNTKIALADTSSLDAILPLLLVSGLGGTGTSGTSGGSGGLGLGDGSDGGLLLLALALAFFNKPN
jgi:hypothetical protein